jgi:hypothetical protein
MDKPMIQGPLDFGFFGFATVVMLVIAFDPRSRFLNFFFGHSQPIPAGTIILLRLIAAFNGIVMGSMLVWYGVITRFISR